MMDGVSNYFPPLNDVVAADRSMSFPLPVLCAINTNASSWVKGTAAGGDALIVLFGGVESVEAGYDVLHPTGLHSLIDGPIFMNLTRTFDLICSRSYPGCTSRCATFTHNDASFLSVMKMDVHGNGLEDRFEIQQGGKLQLAEANLFKIIEGFIGFVVKNDTLHMINHMQDAALGCKVMKLVTVTQPKVEINFGCVPEGVSRVVYVVEDIASPLIYHWEVRGETRARQAVMLLPDGPSVTSIALMHLRQRGDLYSFMDYTGERVIAVPSGKGVALHSVQTGKEIRRLCCANETTVAVRAIVPGQNETFIYTVGNSLIVRRWRAEEEDLQFPLRYGGEDIPTLELFASDKGLVVVGNTTVELFQVEPAPLEAGSKSATIGYNVSMLVVLLAFVFFSMLYKQNFSHQGRSRRRTFVGTPEQAASAAAEENDSLTAKLYSSFLGFWSRVKVFFGIKIALEHYEVERLPDYNPNMLNVYYALQGAVCYIPLQVLHRIRNRSVKSDDEVVNVSLCGVAKERRDLPQQGCLSWLNIYTTHFILVTYLVFVAVTFSPNVLGSYVGPAAGPANGKVCADRELKLIRIKEDMLEFSNVSAGEIQVSLHKQRPKDMLAVITAANQVDKNNPPFPNFPNFTKCSGIIDGKRDELLRQIQKDDCRFDSIHVPILERVSYRYVFPYHRFTPHLLRQELPPRAQNKRQCAVDPSLLSDIDQLRDIVDGYIAPQARSFEEVDEVVEDAYSELMKTLLFQANFAADMYIFYVCACLLVRPPLRLGKSRTIVLVKRSFLNWQQIPFVIMFTVLAYVLPILLEDFNFAQLFEKWAKFLANAGADMCFVQPSFIASVADTVFKTCEEITTLEDEFLAIGQEAAKISRDASAYFLCQNPSAAAQAVLTELELMANETLSVPFAARLCEDIGNDVLLEQFSTPPQSSLSVEPTAAFFRAIGVLLQLFGKFILVNFGLSLARTLDPLSFHGGRVEVIPNARSHHRGIRRSLTAPTTDELENPNGRKRGDKSAPESELILPPAADVADFLRKTYAIGMMYHFGLVLCFLLNLAIVLHTQIENAREADVAVFWACAIFAVGAFYAIIRNDRKRDAAREADTESEGSLELSRMESIRRDEE